MRILTSAFLATLGLAIGSQGAALAQTTQGSETVWSLQQAIQHGVQNNLQVRQAGLRVEQATADVNQAGANQPPTTNGSASYGNSFACSNGPATYEQRNEEHRRSHFSS